MGKNLLVISCDVRETRVALIEDGIIAELHIERRGPHGQTSTVGNVYLGKVTRVLPGLQAAFIDIGQERAAFLHVEDLIRPDDFEAYLAGGKKFSTKQEDIEEIATGDEELDAEKEAELDAAPAVAPSNAEGAEAGPSAASADDDDDDELLVAPSNAEESALDVAAAAAVAAEHRAHPHGEVSEDDLSAHDDDDANDDVSDDSNDDDRSSLPPPSRSTEDVEAQAAGDDDEDADVDTHAEDADADADLDAAESDEDADLDASDDVADEAAASGAAPAELPDWPDMPGFTISDPGAPARRAASPSERSGGGNGGGGRGRGRRRGRGRGGRDESREGRSSGRDGRKGGREGGGREGGRRGERPMSASRISKSTPIKDVVKEGQEVVVQVTKEPIGTKGARCTSHVSLPGRYVVYLPTVEHVGISKRIGSDEERKRLRDAIQSVKPPTGGLIMRTVAEGLTKKQLKQDVGYLVRLWAEIAKKKSETNRAPALLVGELDLVLKTARDLFTDEVDQIVIDDRREFDRLTRFVEMFAPDRLKDVALYSGDEPIFDAYGIEDEIQRALSRKVPLPSGGYLIIDQAEALTAIDVNTGRFVGKNSKDMEETILKTNLEAVHEIAYQLRFRNIGGLIILDLIDMEKAANREKVRRALEDILQKDKAKTSLNRISDLGLIEMTRKRTRESLGRLLHEPCFYCDGTGQLMSKETIAYEILREIRRKKADLPGYTVIVNCHPAVADLLQGPEKGAVADAENKYMRKIQVFPRGEYHYEQFDILGK